MPFACRFNTVAMERARDRASFSTLYYLLYASSVTCIFFFTPQVLTQPRSQSERHLAGKYRTSLVVKWSVEKAEHDCKLCAQSWLLHPLQLTDIVIVLEKLVTSSSSFSLTDELLWLVLKVRMFTDGNLIETCMKDLP